MLLRPSVPHQHLHHKEHQRESQEVHELLIILLEYDRTVSLVLHLPYVVDDRIQTELTVSSPYINSVSCRRNLLKHRLIQSCHNDLSILILQKFSIHRDRLSLRRTDSDSEHADSKLRRLLRRRYRVILMVLTICDHNDSTALVALRAEASHRCIYRISYRSSLHRHGLCRDGTEEHLGRNIVCRDRKLHERVAGKHDQTDSVFTQLVHNPRDRKLRTLQPVGRIILSKHRIGHIEHDHDLRSLCLMLLQLRADLRSCKTYHEEEERNREEHQTHPCLGLRIRRHQAAYKSLISELPEPAPPELQNNSLNHKEERDQEKKQKILCMSKIYHGNLLIINQLNTSSRSMASKASSAYFPKSSLYIGKLSTVVRAFSILLISL